MNTANETVEVAAALPLACLDCGGDGGVVAIVDMADEAALDCEACEGDGEAICQLCGDAPAVAVLLSPFRELACVECGAVARAEGTVS